MVQKKTAPVDDAPPLTPVVDVVDPEPFVPLLA